MAGKIVKILLIVLGVLVLAFVGVVIYEMTIGLEKPPQEVLPPTPPSEEIKEPATCLFTREPEETWPDETVDDPPIGNVELVKIFHPNKTFDVFGSNVREVVVSLSDNNAIPADMFSGKGFAATESTINFIWHQKNTSVGCILTSAKVTLDIWFILPNWVDKSSASDQDQKMWELYQEFVKRHEQGHVNLALKSARELQTEFAQIKSAPNCQELKDQMNALAKEKRKKRIDADHYYDTRTRHGGTQIPHESNQMQYPFPFTCNWREIKI